MTLGMLRICEAVGVDLEAAPTMADLAVLAWLLCGPLGRAELLAMAKQGREAVQEAADAFTWDLSKADLESIMQGINGNAAPGGGGAEPASKS
jgi:hypothetical protein